MDSTTQSSASCACEGDDGEDGPDRVDGAVGGDGDDGHDGAHGDNGAVGDESEDSADAEVGDLDLTKPIFRVRNRRPAYASSSVMGFDEAPSSACGIDGRLTQTPTLGILRSPISCMQNRWPAYAHVFV